MLKSLRKIGDWRTLYIFILALIGLYLAGRMDYLLFHTLIELVMIAIAACAFIIAWNGQRLHANAYLLILGMGFGALAVLTLAHVLVYKGMNVIPQADLTLSTQLWVASRGVLALSLLIAPLLLGRNLRRSTVLLIYAAVTALIFCSIFVWRIFPITFIEGSGVTLFKTLAEYAICLIMAVALILLWRQRAEFHPTVIYQLSAAMIFFIAAELAFSSYLNLYGMSNIIGHLLAFISFSFFYLGIVRTGFAQPLQLLFRDLKEREISLQRSEERYRSLFNSMAEGFAIDEIICDAGGKPYDLRFLQVNPAFERHTGLKAADIIGRTVLELFPQAEPSWFERYGKVALTGEPAHFEAWFGPLGRCFEVSVYQTEPGRFATVFFDITERKQAEEQMTWLASFPQQNPAPVVEVEADGKLVYANAAAQKLLPDLAERGLAHSWLAGLDDLLRSLRENSEMQIIREVQIGDLWYRQMLTPVQEGRRVRIYSMDITARRQAELQLKEIAEKYSTLFNTTSDGVLIHNLNGEILEVNAAYCGRSGYSRDELRGMSISQLEEVESPFGIADQIKKVIAMGGHDSFESRHRRRDGSIFDVDITALYFEEKAGPRIAIFVRDITVRKQAEQQLLEAEQGRARLAETLVSEIGHRTKNNLAIVAGLLQLQMDQAKTAVSGVDLIQDAVTRILSFAALHEQMYQGRADSIELVDALQRIAEINRQNLSSGEISISVEGEPIVYPSSVATNICVVANELLTNAIKYGQSDEGARQVEVRISRQAGQLTLSIWNSGNAIAENFDIKKSSRTGLGLVYTIVVDQYGGSFTLTPERTGTVARIVLPEKKLLEGF